jgi:iron complex outermembrane receptor protein
MLLLLACRAHAADAPIDRERDFNIAPQALATALTAFSAATQIQVVTASADLGAVQSPGIRRRASAGQALAELLRGTSLQFEMVGADTVVITAIRSAPPAPLLGPLEDVVVIGHGYTRASNTITPLEIAAHAPGTPVQVLLDELPGVNVQGSDPFGLYEFGNSVRVRGFGSEQLGISLDGVPLESYDVRDGSPPGRFVDAEDLSTVTIAQGSGDVMMPSYHALGGSVRYFTDAPGGSWRSRLTTIAGSNDLRRLYGRFDTPAWGEGGPVAMVTGSRTRAVQFDNPYADMAVDHAGFKLQQNFDSGEALLSYRYGRRDDHDMQSYDASGHVAGYFDLLEHLSGDPDRDALYYGYWTNSRTDHLLSLDLKLKPAAGWALVALPYYERKRGWGYAGVAPTAAQAQYNAAISADAGGVPDRDDIEPYDGSGITERRETLSGDRAGLTFGATREWSWHTLQFGGWFERYRFMQARPLYNVDDDGRVETEHLPIVNYYDRHFDTQVSQFYLKDSSRWLDERLVVDLGFKGLYVDRSFRGIPNLRAFQAGEYVDIDRVDHDLFQPQFGLSYKLDAAREVFANYAENFSAAPRNALGSVTYEPQLRPETSRNIDLGVRQFGGRFNASASLYYIDYAHRILQLTVSDPYQISEEVYRNVGSIRTYGLELASIWKPLRALRLSSTVSLNRSTFLDNYLRYDANQQTSQPVMVKGKTLPDTPNLMATLSARYQWRQVSLDASAKYTGRRYSTAINDEYVDDNTIVDLSARYEFETGSPHVDSLRLQLHADNLFDVRYVGYITPAEFIDNDNHGSYFLGAPRALYLSLSADLR